MHINNFPIEILEKIFTYINYDTRLELVCSLWNNICIQKFMIKYRISCKCHLNPYSKNKCKSYYHECICMITPNHTLICIAKNHQCVCNLISIINSNILSPNYITNCKSKNHPCVCHLGVHFRLNCNYKHYL